MKTTRRDASILAALAPALYAMPQIAANDLTIPNSARITIRPSGDQRTPAGSVSRPHTCTDAAVVIVANSLYLI
jgi:hypothetical protein